MIPHRTLIDRSIRYAVDYREIWIIIVLFTAFAYYTLGFAVAWSGLYGVALRVGASLLSALAIVGIPFMLFVAIIFVCTWLHGGVHTGHSVGDAQSVTPTPDCSHSNVSVTYLHPHGAIPAMSIRDLMASLPESGHAALLVLGLVLLTLSVLWGRHCAAIAGKGSRIDSTAASFCLALVGSVVAAKICRRVWQTTEPETEAAVPSDGEWVP